MFVHEGISHVEIGVGLLYLGNFSNFGGRSVFFCGDVPEHIGLGILGEGSSRNKPDLGVVKRPVRRVRGDDGSVHRGVLSRHHIGTSPRSRHNGQRQHGRQKNSSSHFLHGTHQRHSFPAVLLRRRRAPRSCRGDMEGSPAPHSPSLRVLLFQDVLPTPPFPARDALFEKMVTHFHSHHRKVLQKAIKWKISHIKKRDSLAFFYRKSFLEMRNRRF